ncbi:MULTISPECIES: EamA family transporter [Cyanophyceae]|uniref:DMT family transporter n=1 Tax=Cyanophyceae TaxID=3028117 RepID=UPI0016888A8B|nr:MULTISPECIES: EamA family transporter [Cyanophyceae]MBD1916547.1 EamA family transporter [Phormidium sp. FACHB-77]MBD2032114.1 EamA family transporter [Phormidium sp. FACHB-322]MBD2052994.1 EamA family transporter [Leptolyngbya sp. FACHB-60]
MDSVSAPQSATRNLIVLIAPFFLWGTAMVAMKGAMPHTTPFFMAGIRLLPAGLIVLLAGLFLGRPQGISRQGWLWIALFALVDGTLFQGFLAAGLQRTGAGLGSVMIDSQPLAVAVMARGLFGEYIGTLGWIGLLWGIAGISLLGLPDEWIFSLFHGDTAWLTEGTALTTLLQGGEWLMLLAALSMATGTILIRYVCRHVDPVVATGWHMVLGGVPLFVLSALGEGQPWQGLTGLDWGAIAYSTIFGSALAYGIFFFLAAQGNLTSLSALTFLTPVFALLFGNLFLAETLSSLQWLGVSFTLVSIYLINQRDALTQRLRQLTLAYETATSAKRTPVEPD